MSALSTLIDWSDKYFPEGVDEFPVPPIIQARSELASMHRVIDAVKEWGENGDDEALMDVYLEYEKGLKNG